MSISIVQAHAATIEAHEALGDVVASPEFHVAASDYGHFMCSAEASAAVSKAEFFVLSTMDGADMDLGPDTDEDSIHLIGRYNHTYQVSIPMRWFTNNEAFRAEAVAKASARDESHVA